MEEKKVPLRMCVACRVMKPKAELIKVTKNKDGVIAAGMPEGRGAYVCRDEACRSKCVKSRLFHKAFRCAVPDGVYEVIKNDEGNA